nr:pathogenesis-related genes transcriptional activator PTI6-like [Ipomoea batatas]
MDGNGNGNPVKYRVEKTVTLKQFKGGLCHNMPKVVRISVTNDDATNSSGDEGEFRGSFQRIMKKHVSEGGLCHNMPKVVRISVTDDDPTDSSGDDGEFRGGFLWIMKKHISEVMAPNMGPLVEHRAPPRGPMPLAPGRRSAV